LTGPFFVWVLVANPEDSPTSPDEEKAIILNRILLVAFDLNIFESIRIALSVGESDPPDR